MHILKAFLFEAGQVFLQPLDRGNSLIRNITPPERELFITNSPPPKNSPRMALFLTKLLGPRSALFLMGEVALYLGEVGDEDEDERDHQVTTGVPRA